MKNLFLILFVLVFVPAFSKTVNLTLNAKVSTCPKNTDCAFKESVHEFSIPLSPLADTGLDYGIGDLVFKTTAQKFGFKVIASSLEADKNIEVVFLIMDESYRLNTFTLVMDIPETLNGKLRLNSPVFTDAKGNSSSVGIEVSKLSTLP